MSLRLRVLNGPQKGATFPIQDSLTLGRGKAQVSLMDPKISSQHARIRREINGDFFLEDLGSRNGIVFEQKKVPVVHLFPGAEVQLGSTRLRVELEPKPKPLDEVLLDDKGHPAPEVEPVKDEWPLYFEAFIESTKTNIKDNPQTIYPFPKVVEFHILRGPQINWVWKMGYGPRHVGKTSLDFPLYDAKAPDQAFTVTLKDGEIAAESPHKQLVRLNQKPLVSEKLNAGDILTIGDTLMKVQFKDS